MSMALATAGLRTEPLRRARRLPLWLATLLLGLLAALPMVLVTPPLQAPDEPQHFYKAYRISEGAFFGEVRGVAAGGTVPSALAEFTDRFMGTRDNFHRAFLPHPLRETLPELARPLDPARREFVDFTTTAAYAPLAYAPQALAIAAGRAAGLGPLGLSYAGRTANALAAVLLLALAVALCPFGRGALLLAGLLPMAVFEYASLAPDGMIIATALLFTALSFRGEARGRWTVAEAAGMAACGLVFCSIKVVYAPLLLLGAPALLVPARRRNAALVHAAVLAAVLIPSWAWMHASAGMLVQWAPGVDMPAQLRHVLSNPFGYAEVLLLSLLVNEFHYQEMVGVLGWLTITLPAAAYALPALGLLAAAAQDDEPALPWWSLAWKAAMSGACVVLVMTALYLLWTPVGRPVVYGVQGRYILPAAGVFAAVLACALAPLLPARTSGAQPVLLAIVAALLAVAGTCVAGAYRVF